MREDKRFYGGDTVREIGSQGYAFSGKKLTYKCTAGSISEKLAICKNEENGEYHLVPVNWLMLVPKKCACCGQVVPR